MDKLLIIGAGIGQAPLIAKAKEKGAHVTAVTLPGDQPGIKMADEVLYEDIFSKDSIVGYAKEHGITAVASDQNDLMMPTVSYVAEKLGLPGNSYDKMMSYCNKNRFRDNCDRIGIPVPRHTALSSEDFDVSGFDCPLPWIVKPADSQSSVGVRRIDDPKDAPAAIKEALSHSRSGSAILEEYFFGREIVCEGFIEDGEYHLLAFADRKYFDIKGVLIPCQTLFPSVVGRDLLERVLECERKMASYIQPSFAIVHSEYLVNEETGEIRAVESALRGGGVYISSDIIPLVTGVDLTGLMLDKALGRKVNAKDIIANRQERAGGYICFSLPEGRITGINGLEELRALPFVEKVFIDPGAVGEKTEKMIHKGLRKGPVIVSAKDRQELERNMKTVTETLDIRVEDGNGNSLGIIWG
ncbi:MAG: ATP-grasp domain-containing protein [Ruminococcus sp.]|nr:ATP-grasp domain-containing protein [Ruminococcus sp.]